MNLRFCFMAQDCKGAEASSIVMHAFCWNSSSHVLRKPPPSSFLRKQKRLEWSNSRSLRFLKAYTLRVYCKGTEKRVMLLLNTNRTSYMWIPFAPF